MIKYKNMGNKNSKTPKKKPLDFYQEFIDKQSKEMYGEYEEISNKIQKSKQKLKPPLFKEKCLSCCFDSSILNEVLFVEFFYIFD